MVGTPDPPLVPVSPHKAAPSSVFTAEEAGQGTQGGGGGGIVRGGVGRGGLSIKQPGRNLETIKHGAETVH